MACGSAVLLGLWVAARAVRAQGEEPCTSGLSAGVYPCRAVSLLVHLPLSAFPGAPVSASNLWGFADPKDGREYALIGLSNGTAVVEVTDPLNPRIVGLVPAFLSSWREVKVYAFFKGGRRRAYAYVSTEARGQGLQVLDLNGLPDSVKLAREEHEIDTAHTLFVANVDFATGLPVEGLTPTLYTEGVHPGNGGLVAFSLSKPRNPRRVGEYQDTYVHDIYAQSFSGVRAAQCGPGHDPCELVFAWAGSDVRLIDFTDKQAPILLSQLVYPGIGYAHSGWISRDQQFLFNFDEFDESRSGLPTRILTLSIADLRAPGVAASWSGPDHAIEHNGYVVGNRLYVAHYTRGLVIFNARQPTHLREIAHFDTDPTDNSTSFHGAWGVYPFLPSGTLLISDIEGGLFVVRQE